MYYSDKLVFITLLLVLTLLIHIGSILQSNTFKEQPGGKKRANLTRTSSSSSLSERILKKCSA